MPKEIKEHALFIADAHYPHHGDTLFKILRNLENGKLKTPQLFLMGDIFDLLFGHNEYIKTFSQEVIHQMNQLSKKIEIIYIEGNHDFCLQEVFPNIKVYNRREQPLHYKLGEQDVYLSHGDKHKTGFGYNVYSNILRRKTTLALLHPFEKPIINHRMKKLKVKRICGEFKGYEKRFDAIRSHYPNDSLIIEGHFHQGLIHQNYISLPSLACQNNVAIVKNGNIVFLEVARLLG
ncbi:MAG: UDP-2,3-diacylglucosamine diphosphatase [Sulfurovum sp.]|nr:MAG: UDP-2,3-diacylglucosamine diphosphatase [Sulfurovum sp.]